VSRDLLCFSHLRWDFVYQRPNHLMARAARDRRVFFVEEPVFEPDVRPELRSTRREGVVVLTPFLPEGLAPDAVDRLLAGLVDRLVRAERIRRPVLWYSTPMALPWTRHLDAGLRVFDSMDFLAGFRGAPPALLRLEKEMVATADLVFSGGVSLHERMAGRHPDSHCFPSSVDVDHFGSARRRQAEPADLAPIVRPRLGYAGVIDERIDLELLEGVARARPDLQVVLVGPVAKIDAADLPVRPNIHQLGMKSYEDLPAYLGSWDIGWMPFARNEATRFISPTKTPEYLAAGLPVVSTSIRDVVDPYGKGRLVSIADTVEDTLTAVDRALAGERPSLAAVDAFLADRSWDATWRAMRDLIEDRLERVPVQRDRLVASAAGRRLAPSSAPRVAVPARTPLPARSAVPTRSALPVASNVMPIVGSSAAGRSAGEGR
jgi:UDP-galactopyranose mutase